MAVTPRIRPQGEQPQGDIVEHFTFGEQPDGNVDDRHQFGQLGGADRSFIEGAHRAKTDPPEDHDQHQGSQRAGHHQNGDLLVEVIIDQRGDDDGNQADACPDELADEVMVGRGVDVAGEFRPGRVDHQQAKKGQRDGHADQDKI